jgi:predicted NBD/HSP70 family sugar kinase
MSNNKLKLGIDIGGSKILAVLWDGKRVVEKYLSEEVTVETLEEIIFPSKASQVGLGIPGILDSRKRKILKCPNLESFSGLDVDRISKKEMRLDNDANCFLRAEARLGAGKGYKNILAVTMGTGIGGGLMIEGKIYYGAKGSAGEIGHMIIEKNKTWERLYQENKGNFQKQKKIHAIALANLINVFNPEVIILGGAGAIKPERELIVPYLVSPLTKETPIVLGELGPEAGAIGAALLFEM